MNHLKSIQNALPPHSWWQQSSNNEKGYFGGSFWTELYVPHAKPKKTVLKLKPYKYTYAQETRAMEYLSDSFTALEKLCNDDILKIHQILILSAEMMDMFEFIPSVSEYGMTVDMRDSELCPAIIGLAGWLEAYYDAPLSVTQEMIQADAIKIADHIYG